MGPSKSIIIKNSIIIGGISEYSDEQKDDFEELEKGLELLSKLKSIRKDVVVSDELKELRDSVEKLTSSINELPNRQEYLDTIQRDLKEIKDYLPGMEGRINEVLSQLNSPSNSITQKLEVAIPIIPQVISYKIEMNVPKSVTDKIKELKNLLRFE